MLNLISGLGSGAVKGLASKAGQSGLLGSLGAGASKVNKYLTANPGVGSSITQGIGNTITGLSAGQDIATSVISGGLDIASSIPGPIGWAGKALKVGDMILGKSINAKEANIDDEVEASTSFEQLGSEQSSINKDVQDYNARGGFSKLIGLKKKKGIDSSRKTLEKQGRAAGIELNQGAQDLSTATSEASLDNSWQNSLNNARGTLKRTSMFKKGGKIEIEESKPEEQNVIIDGALHARKHNIELEDANITKKGVPVIINEDGGEVKQVAEFETGEIVLTKSLTEKIEELAKKGDKDAKIEAGKLLTYEILNNTIDNSEKLLSNE